MSQRLHVTPRAARDLDAVFDYLAAREPTAAVRVVLRLERAFQRLAAAPLLGTACDELAAGLRYWTVGSYVVYYHPAADGVQIVRVLHGAQNAGRVVFDA